MPPLVMFTSRATTAVGGFWPSADGGAKSLDLDGVNERLRNTSANDVNIGNLWSWEFWYKPFGWSGSKELFSIRVNTANSNDRVRIFCQTAPRLRINLNGPAGGLAGQVDIGKVSNTLLGESADLGLWWQMVICKNDPVFNTYLNGAPASQTIVTAPSAQGNALRMVSIGGDIVSSPSYAQGRVYSCALWSKVLTAEEVTTLYNAGNARRRDLTQDAGDYAGSAALKHWWQPGKTAVPPEANMGLDYGSGGASINLMTNQENITSAQDLVDDAPGT